MVRGVTVAAMTSFHLAVSHYLIPSLDPTILIHSPKRTVLAPSVRTSHSRPSPPSLHLLATLPLTSPTLSWRISSEGWEQPVVSSFFLYLTAAADQVCQNYQGQG